MAEIFDSSCTKLNSGKIVHVFFPYKAVPFHSNYIFLTVFFLIFMCICLLFISEETQYLRILVGPGYESGVIKRDRIGSGFYLIQIWKRIFMRVRSGFSKCSIHFSYSQLSGFGQYQPRFPACFFLLRIFWIRGCHPQSARIIRVSTFAKPYRFRCIIYSVFFILLIIIITQWKE